LITGGLKMLLWFSILQDEDISKIES